VGRTKGAKTVSRKSATICGEFGVGVGVGVDVDVAVGEASESGECFCSRTAVGSKVVSSLVRDDTFVGAPGRRDVSVVCETARGTPSPVGLSAVAESAPAVVVIAALESAVASLLEVTASGGAIDCCFREGGGSEPRSSFPASLSRSLSRTPRGVAGPLINLARNPPTFDRNPPSPSLAFPVFVFLIPFVLLVDDVAA